MLSQITDDRLCRNADERTHGVGCGWPPCASAELGRLNCKEIPPAYHTRTDQST